MSANNLITIHRRTFVVKELDAESDYGFVVKRARNLEEAIQIAEKYMRKEEVEYGIRFIG